METGAPDQADAVAAALAPLRGIQQQILAALRANPFESMCALVGGAAAVFYWAEHGENDKVEDYSDAVHYVATSLSVGYANVFPVTPVGKIVGALIMMIGPALTSHALDPWEDPVPGGPELLAKLDEILVELRRMGEAR